FRSRCHARQPRRRAPRRAGFRSGACAMSAAIDRDHPLLVAIAPVIDAVGARLVAADAAEASDVPLVWEGETIAAVRLPPLHGALDRLIDSVAAELGGPLPTLSREDKQRAVRLLDER